MDHIDSHDYDDIYIVHALMSPPLPRCFSLESFESTGDERNGPLSVGGVKQGKF
jgi:hypothetical protein